MPQPLATSGACANVVMLRQCDPRFAVGSWVHAPTLGVVKIIDKDEQGMCQLEYLDVFTPDDVPVFDTRLVHVDQLRAVPEMDDSSGIGAILAQFP